MQLAPFASDGVSQVKSQVVAIEAKLAAAESNRMLAEQAENLQKSSGENMVQSLKQDLEATKQKYNQAKSEVLSLKADLEDKKNQWEIAKRVAAPGVGLESLESLYSKEQAVESQFNKVVKAQGAVDEAFAMLMAKEKEIISKEQEIDIKNRAATQKVGDEVQKIETIKKELTDLKNKADEFDRLEVRAPKSGYIQQWNGLEGSDTVKEGDQLFVLVPETESLSVEMLVSGNDMPLVQEGDRVRLQFEGWPAVQFVGWPSVAVGTFGGKVNRVFPTDDGRGFFRVVVTPDRHFEGENDWPDGRYLRQGVRSNGWVLLKQVPLGYEIWRQLNGFPPIVADSEPKGPKEKEPKVNLPKL
jgi:multidrug resistance efflux pump